MPPAFAFRAAYAALAAMTIAGCAPVTPVRTIDERLVGDWHVSCIEMTGDESPGTPCFLGEVNSRSRFGFSLAISHEGEQPRVSVTMWDRAGPLPRMTIDTDGTATALAQCDALACAARGPEAQAVIDTALRTPALIVRFDGREAGRLNTGPDFRTAWEAYQRARRPTRAS
jgi:hypothetical protein